MQNTETTTGRHHRVFLAEDTIQHDTGVAWIARLEVRETDPTAHRRAA